MTVMVTATPTEKKEVETEVPEWYTNAHPDNFPHHGGTTRRTLDEARTALLDYPHPSHILSIRPGCVSIQIKGEYAADVGGFLIGRGFRMFSTIEGYRQQAERYKGCEISVIMHPRRLSL